MIPEDRRKALEDGARADLDAPITDFSDIGRKIEAGIVLVGLALLEGVSDLLTFFGDVYEFFSDISKLVVPWDEIQSTPEYYDPDACEPACSRTRTDEPENLNKLKEECWCKDEFNCRVKLPEKRRCENKWKCDPFPPICWPEKNCGEWSLVPTKTKNKDGNDVFPRFDGQKYDKACREERCIALAEMEEKQGEMQTNGDIIADNWNNRLKGLFVLRPIVRRRLNGEPVVKVGGATSRGTVSSEDMSSSFEFQTDLTDFTKLSPNELDPSMKSTRDTKMFDPSVYNRGPNGDGSVTSGDENDFAYLLNNRTSCAVLGDIDPCDETFIAANGNIDPPILEKTDTRSKIMLGCADHREISSAWEDKLLASDQSSMRRHRSRRLQGQKPTITVLDRAVMEVLRRQIISGDVGVRITPGSVNNDANKDAFAEFRQ